MSVCMHGYRAARAQCVCRRSGVWRVCMRVNACVRVCVCVRQYSCAACVVVVPQWRARAQGSGQGPWTAPDDPTRFIESTATSPHALHTAPLMHARLGYRPHWRATLGRRRGGGREGNARPSTRRSRPFPPQPRVRGPPPAHRHRSGGACGRGAPALPTRGSSARPPPGSGALHHPQRPTATASDGLRHAPLTCALEKKASSEGGAAGGGGPCEDMGPFLASGQSAPLPGRCSSVSCGIAAAAAAAAACGHSAAAAATRPAAALLPPCQPLLLMPWRCCWRGERGGGKVSRLRIHCSLPLLLLPALQLLDPCCWLLPPLRGAKGGAAGTRIAGSRAAPGEAGGP